jgi:nitrous oxide reductase accessory protein NosL
MNKSLLLASVIAVVALSACGKKEEAAPAAPAPVSVEASATVVAPAASEAPAAAAAVAASEAASK